ncbi:O-methyltransferase [Candidatus Woesearchaeota archaeon]|nr:O-methyltransferase [Candidatus Woesearchaeota archaeon]
MRAEVLDFLRELVNYSRNKGYPIIPEDTAKFIYSIVLSSKRRNALEIGTCNGYSAIWIAEALRENNGNLVTIEIEKAKAAEASDNFEKAGIKNIKIINGNAIEEIKKLDGKFDFLFLDAMKKEYIDYMKLIEDNLEKNAIIIADNAGIFSEKMKSYLDYVRKSEKYSSVFVPIGSGVEFTVKL